MSRRRKGRGRLSSIDLLPEAAQDDVILALAQLNEKKRTQEDIREEFNKRLSSKGVKPISSSAFSRRALRLAEEVHELEDRRYVYAGIAEKLTPEYVNQGDMVLGEFLKTVIGRLRKEEGLNSKNIMELARAFKDTIAAETHSAQARRKADLAARSRTMAALDGLEQSMPEEAATKDGQAVIRKIREEIYGIYEPRGGERGTREQGK